MDFRILGPIEVWADGRPVVLGGGQQRAVLALLLLDANRVVSSDRLIDQLWDGHPPATAATALQGHISALRKALGSDVIATRRPGYLFTLDPEQTDLGRFERLRGEARRALERGDAGTGGEKLREALALWRGEALADVGFEPSIRGEAARLEDLRLATLEDRIDADLAVGRSADLVDELERLVAANPLREHLWGQLMLALYRAGRQADALDAYRRARRALVAELGLEPGPALRELERQMLAQDPALDPEPQPLARARAPDRGGDRHGWRLAPSPSARSSWSRSCSPARIRRRSRPTPSQPSILPTIRSSRASSSIPPPVRWRPAPAGCGC